MRVLLVEHESDEAQRMAQGLNEASYSVDVSPFWRIACCNFQAFSPGSITSRITRSYSPSSTRRWARSSRRCRHYQAISTTFPVSTCPRVA